MNHDWLQSLKTGFLTLRPILGSDTQLLFTVIITFLISLN